MQTSLSTDKILDLTKKPLFMGILNCTPDSFSDGGKYFKLDNALKHAQDMINQGADIIDIGGESTRPGAKPVSEEEEIKRIIPIIKEIKKIFQKVYISVDTYKSNVAKLALEAGANMINDVSGLTMDENMVKVAREADCPIVIMHNRGIPATKPITIDDCKGGSVTRPANGNDKDVVKEILHWLKTQTDYAIKNGIKKENIIIDPGIGFGKSPEEDLFLIEHLDKFKSLKFSILVGPSNKSFIKKLFGDNKFEVKSKEIIDNCINNGASIIRKHYL